jgi:phenylacetate-coenzyme A ligase PaaK-like adenylate-forming protein
MASMVDAGGRARNLTAARPPPEAVPPHGRVTEARARLDAHTREIVAWHFDPKTGCPFWLEYAKTLGWDPRKEVQGYNDLDKLPFFEDEWLRGGPVRRWVPKAYANRPVYIFETGGSTGVPKSRINIEDFRIDYEMFSETLSDDSFPKGSDWLMLGPSGPRRSRLAVEHLCQHRGGICFLVDLDPRWVVKLIGKGRMDVMIEYRDHVINQGLTLLRAHETIRCLFTTPKLLEALCEKVSLARMGIKGVFCGGTQLTAQFNRFAREELLEGKVELVPTYGNTLMGLACHKPSDPADNYSVIYHPPCPRAMIEVVDPNEPHRVVEYGQLGRVRLTTLTKEFFMPRFLERDEAGRRPPCEKYPWDGAGDVRPFSGFATPIVEEVY